MKLEKMSWTQVNNNKWQDMIGFSTAASCARTHLNSEVQEHVLRERHGQSRNERSEEGRLGQQFTALSGRECKEC